jgi:hypothetical protein
VAEVTTKGRDACSAQSRRRSAVVAPEDEFSDSQFVGFRDLELWRFARRPQVRVMLRCLALELRSYCDALTLRAAKSGYATRA